VAPELCRILEKPPLGPGWIHEVKFDGYRIEMRVAGADAQLLTRRGLDWAARFPEIANEGSSLPDCLLDGEIVALNKDGVSDFAALQRALSEEKTAALVYFVFDLLYADGRDLRDAPLSLRKERLESFLKRHARRARHIRYVGHFETGGEAILEAACRMKLEGVVSKRLDAPYRSGRGDDWVKSKCRAGQEVVIGGWWGTAAKLRSLLVGAHREGRLVYLGRVGTGFNARSAKALLAKLKPLERASTPFHDAPPRTRDVHWVEPKLVSEVEFGTFTSAGLLRQASFKGPREDKPARAVVVEAQPAAQRKEAGTMRRKKDDPLEIAGLVISHAEKELWPAAKPDPAFTKGDLARHYEAFAKRILPHVAGRPISMLRAPDGIEGQKFFQRHANKQGIAGRDIKVKGEGKPYLAIDDLEGLISLAQAAVLEIHPWGAKKDDPDVPERVIIDLDPAPDVKFDAVIGAAKQLRERFKACGLEPFVKTTGGKGMHVVAAVAAARGKSLDWSEVKDFARRLCVALARDNPDTMTTTMAKKSRAGKIFLDYLRNGRTATAIAPWCPRARPHAPVATPLEWTQLRKGLDPLSFTLRTAPALLSRADPWADLQRSAGSLQTARNKLEKMP